ncbi:hypothetical protein MMC21_006534 [Puttea exsequens]|nr:hypothetical protein [Puttea exsequens]
MPSPTTAPTDPSVLIIGAGPVGLLTAYILARSSIPTHIIESRSRSQQIAYGRAAMIAPRTLEMLDQLDLADALLQVGFVVRGQTAWNGDGERVEGGRTSAASGLEGMGTWMDFLLLVRQRWTEEVVREAYERVSGQRVRYGARLEGFKVEEGRGGKIVKAEVVEEGGGRCVVRSRFIVGADGGRSTVRDVAGIPFQGEQSRMRWVRIDGVVETDMPDARRGIAGIQSPTYGSVLFACLDHGATRVGFALPEELWEELGDRITREDIIEEAKKAVKPFYLNFKTVDWWTVYSVGQRLAERYRDSDCVFIAGDAAHTHSSGAAQGMNTGLHDAVNLSWKLAGCLNGWLDRRVLDTYDAERRPIAQKIIEQDKIISVLNSGELPEQYKHDKDADPSRILTETYKANSALNTGLGIEYPSDGLTISELPSKSSKVKLGQRAPDVLVQRPGVRLPLRLQFLTKFDGKFRILVLCGDPAESEPLLEQLHKGLKPHNYLSEFSQGFDGFIAIIIGHNDFGSPQERLGGVLFGNAYHDVDGSAHQRYGVKADTGAMVVVRPDGAVAMLCGLSDVGELLRYLSNIILRQKWTVCTGNEGDTNNKDLAIGEVMTEAH